MLHAKHSIKLATMAVGLFTAGIANAFTVSVSGSGAMTINGTGGADWARVVGLGAEGAVKVVNPNAETTVWQGPDTVTSILFIGKGGSNTLALTDVNIAGPIVARGGSARDILRVNGMLTAGRLTVDHGGGANKLAAGDSGELASVCYSGCEYDYYGDMIDLANGFTYNSGNGRDVIQIASIMVADENPAEISIETGGGNDKIEISGGGDDDDYYYGYESYISPYNARRIVVQSGPGKDTIDISDLYLDHSLQVFSGSGNDNVYVSGVSFGSNGVLTLTGLIDVITGQGKDTVAVTYNTTDDLNVNCGTENDKYYVDGNLTNTEVVVNCEMYLDP